MASAGSRGRLAWQAATVTAVEPRTPRITSFFFRLPAAVSFTAGQHMDVRLTADDGYQAQRSYSIASAPEQGDRIELAIEKLQDGEVSPFFHDTVAAGDEIELRGPIGGHFTWSVEDGGPVLLVGGGSGVVPLACMARHRAARGSNVPAALVFSARTATDLLYHDEFRAMAGRGDGFGYLPTLTRETSGAPGMRRGRIDSKLIGEALAALPVAPRTVFICGANAFVESAAGLVLGLGVPAERVRTERYGG